MRKIRSILLVDDDTIVNKQNCELINKLGLTDHVHTCCDGRSALDYLAEVSAHDGEAGYTFPALIILDLRMPVLDGEAFLKQYNILYPHRANCTLICMISSSDDPEERERMLGEHGAHLFVGKPLTTKVLNDIYNVLKGMDCFLE
ncbi:MAG: response regulator [Sphingobacteriales bacterium]|nr:MAG: response regulator [Sphingobacteriales bacterium]